MYVQFSIHFIYISTPLRTKMHPIPLRTHEVVGIPKDNCIVQETVKVDALLGT